MVARSTVLTASPADGGEVEVVRLAADAAGAARGGALVEEEAARQTQLVGAPLLLPRRRVLKHEHHVIVVAVVRRCRRVSCWNRRRKNQVSYSVNAQSYVDVQYMYM